MPSKSRRSRRNRPANRTIITETVSTTAGSIQPPVAQTTRAGASSNPALKMEAGASISYPYILSEIKWIGIVAAIIAIILAILYVFFR